MGKTVKFSPRRSHKISGRFSYFQARATVNLTTVAGRDKLPPRREPYYLTLMQGCASGFRKMSSDRAGAWVARYTNSETRKSHKRALGVFDHLVPSERFVAAKAAADAWFEHLGAGGGAQVVTVKVACESYVKHIRDCGQVAARVDCLHLAA